MLRECPDAVETTILWRLYKILEDEGPKRIVIAPNILKTLLLAVFIKY
jgi:hypothetical protein